MNDNYGAAAGHGDHAMHARPYRRLLMYAMVNSIGNVYFNLNQLYMAGLMTAPMVAIGLVLMSSMYPNKRLNVLVLVASSLPGSSSSR